LESASEWGSALELESASAQESESVWASVSAPESVWETVSE
jgi:hypothetical protein